MPKRKKTKRRLKRTGKWKTLEDAAQEAGIRKTTRKLGTEKTGFFKDTGPKERLSRKQIKAIALQKQLWINKATQPSTLTKSSGVNSKKRRVKGESPQQTKKRKLSSVKEKRSSAEDVFDIWGEETEKTKDSTWIQDQKQKKLQVKRKINSKPTALPAVTLPGQALSYNPDRNSHAILINKAVEEQLKKQTEMKKIFKALNPKKLPNRVESSSSEEESSESDNEEEETKYQAHIPRLTRAERNKQKRVKIHERKRGSKARRAAKAAEMALMDESLEEVKKMEALYLERKAAKKESAEAKQFLPRKLGKQSFKRQDIEVQTSSQLASSLRNIEPSFGGLEDRFLNLQKRNIIEARDPKYYHRRYKKKATELHRSRDWNREQTAYYAAKGVHVKL